MSRLACRVIARVPVLSPLCWKSCGGSYIQIKICAVYILNNYSLKSRWIVAKYLLSYEVARYIFLKPLFTEIDRRKIKEETIKKYDLIDRSGQLDMRKFKNRSLQNFQTWQFTSLSLRKQQHNDLNGTAKSVNCFLTWEEKKSFVVFCWLAKLITEKVCCVVLGVKFWQKWWFGSSR